MKKIIISHEYSGIVREAFKKKGCYAISVDLLPSEQPGLHFQGNIWDYLKANPTQDFVGFHPACTYLCNSGGRWLYNNGVMKHGLNKERWDKMEEAALEFKKILDLSYMGYVENPIMHKHAMAIIGVKPTQIIQPYQFGHTTSKATCLWLKGLPPLVPTKIIPEQYRTFEIHKASPGPDRWKERSRTFTGVAEAMAEQWHKLL